MRICSFDLFDTLLTRLVAHPFDIFVELGERLCEACLIKIEPQAFARLRAEAEASARKRVHHGEVTLGEIYEILAASANWDATTAAAARALELEIEQQNLRTVPAARKILDEARQSFDQIYFISDMYLPVDFLRGLLIEAGLYREGDKIFVSHEAQACKATGELFAKVKSEVKALKHWVHHGDNLHSDVKMAAQSGIEAVHFSRCALTRYERALCPEDADAPPLWRSKFAAAMRYSRLSNPASGDHAIVWDTGAQVIGPLLFAFVHWCLETARARGLQRLYFLSRDGFILQRIAQVLIQRWGYPMEARYLYASRLAWQPAALEAITEEQKRWILLPSGAMTVSTCLARVGLEPEEIKAHLLARGIPSSEWDKPLPPEAREMIWEVITHPKVARLAERKNAERRALATEYMRQEGLFEPVPWGMVDIGWHGNLQKSLQQFLGRDDFPGLYFGLFRHDVPLGEQYLDYWCSFDSPRELADRNMMIFELFTAATHGSVRGYQRLEGRIEPVLDVPVETEVIEWGLELLHQSISHFAETFAASVPRPGFSPAELFPLVRSLFDLFYFQPVSAEAAVWGRFPRRPHANEINTASMAPNWPEGKIIAALLDYTKRPTCWWMEGTSAQRFSPSLQLYLLAKRFKARLRK